MLICTCSLFPEENTAQLAAFMQDHADAQCLPLGGGVWDGTEHVAGNDALQLIPQPEHDGFFYALLQKRI